MFDLNIKSRRLEFLFLGIFLYLIQYFFPINYSLQIVFFGLGVMLFGIPHGSLDHFIYHHERKEEMSVKSILRFLLFYVGFAILYALIWLISVELSILLFIIISAYHFGEMDMKALLIKVSLISKIISFLYGFLFLLNYLLYQFPQVESIILSFPGFEQENVHILRKFYTYQQHVMISSLILFVAFLLIYLYQSNQFGYKQIEAIIQLLILLMIVFNMPILLGFGFYFNMWHSGLSLIEIKKFLGWQDKGYLFIYQKAWLTNGASFLMIVVLFIVFHGNIERLLAVFFMAIAILTAPHMKVISRLFSKEP